MSAALVPGPTIATALAQDISSAAAQDNARNELYRAITTLGSDLWYRARSLTRDRDAANDLVQDSIERALKFAAHYQAGTNARAWLWQVMFSVFASKRRRQQRQREILQLLGNEGVEASVEAPESTTVKRQVQAGLGRIPTAFADVVRLVDLQDFSYREAADTLELPLGTVMSRLHRGRQLLRVELDLAA